MPFDWREFLIVAHELRNDQREGAQRTCLGRAYYYVYNLGLNKARTLSFREGPPGLHKKLWNWCQKHADPRIRTMGTHGLRMLSLRHDADYEIAPIPNLAHEVKLQLDRAQTFEALVSQTNGQQSPSPLPP
jgi:hypothetical protein